MNLSSYLHPHPASDGSTIPEFQQPRVLPVVEFEKF